MEEPLTKSQRVECAKCGQMLVRVNATGDAGKDFIEVASGDVHSCWVSLPEEADHIRLD